MFTKLNKIFIISNFFLTHPAKDLLEDANRERGALSSLTQKGIIDYGCEGWCLKELGVRCLILQCLEDGTLEKHID
jgi:hypothetical protein